MSVAETMHTNILFEIMKNESYELWNDCQYVSNN